MLRLMDECRRHHRNVAEREGIAAGMAAFLLHQHALEAAFP